MLIDAIFHHIGVATADIAKTAEAYLAAGYEMSDVAHDSMQNVNIAFLYKPGCPLLELVEPADEASPVRNIIKKVGVTAYHFCYEAINLDESIAQLRQKKFVLFLKPVGSVAFGGRRICFLYHKDVGLIELLEK